MLNITAITTTHAPSAASKTRRSGGRAHTESTGNGTAPGRRLQACRDEATCPRSERSSRPCAACQSRPRRRAARNPQNHQSGESVQNANIRPPCMNVLQPEGPADATTKGNSKRCVCVCQQGHFQSSRTSFRALAYAPPRPLIGSSTCYPDPFRLTSKPANLVNAMFTPRPLGLSAERLPQTTTTSNTTSSSTASSAASAASPATSAALPFATATDATHAVSGIHGP